MSQQKNTKESRIDLSLLIGMTAWEAYKKSPVGKVCLKMLPNDEVRIQAQELFLLAFTARMTIFTPLGKLSLDKLVEDPLVDFVWEDYLRTAKGKIVLDGNSYPDTPPEVLAVAKSYFRIGFKSATFAYYEILAD